MLNPGIGMRFLKINVLLVLVLASFSTVSGLDVSFEENCVGSEPMVSLADEDGGHVSEPGFYNNDVCVEGSSGIVVRDSGCEGDEYFILDMEGNNSHASTFEGEYSYSVCSEDVLASVDQGGLDETCTDENETVGLRLAEQNNTHVAGPQSESGDYSICLSRQQPETVTVSFTSDGNGETAAASSESENVFADGEEISVGETLDSASYPYIAEDSTETVYGLIGYSEFERIERDSSETFSLTQTGESTFIMPFSSGDINTVENRREEVENQELLSLNSPSFSPITVESVPNVNVRLQRPEMVSSDEEFGTTGTITVRNEGVNDEGELEVQIMD